MTGSKQDGKRFAGSVHVRRVYDTEYDAESEPGGARVLVDRLWPRGLSKERARLNRWMKELAPSTELRRWFGHDPAKWREFRVRYFAELDANPASVAELIDLVSTQGVVLLFSARDRERNQAVALAEYLEHRRHQPPDS